MKVDELYNVYRLLSIPGIKPQLCRNETDKSCERQLSLVDANILQSINEIFLQGLQLIQSNFDFIHPNDILKDEFNSRYAYEAKTKIENSLEYMSNEYNACLNNKAGDCEVVINTYLKNGESIFRALVNERLL